MADYSVDTSVIGPVVSDVTADVTSTLTGLDDMKLTLAGGTTTTLAGGTTTTLAGENTVHGDATLTLEPVQATIDSTSKVDSASTVDLRPVAVDSCVRLVLAPPPPTEVHTPYEQRWAFSLLGLEIFALSVRGSTTTHIRAERPQPVVIEV